MSYKTYNKESLEETIKNSCSIAKVLRKIGLVPAGGNYKSIQNYIQANNIDISNLKGSGWNKGLKGIGGKKAKTIDELLTKTDVFISTYKLKLRLIKEGIKLQICECCNISQWNGKNIALELHHIDGNSLNNLIGNLQLLCPNCHSQTENFRGKNKTKTAKNDKSKSQEEKEIQLQNRIIDNDPMVLICNHCLKKFVRNNKGQVFCSKKCATDKLVSTNPTKEEVELVIRDNGLNYSKLAKHFFVSTTTIRKWLYRLGILVKEEQEIEYCG